MLRKSKITISIFAICTIITLPLSASNKLDYFDDNDKIMNLPRFIVAVEQEGEGLQHLANFNYYLAYEKQSDEGFHSKSNLASPVLVPALFIDGLIRGGIFGQKV